MADPVMIAVRTTLYVVLGIAFGLPLFVMTALDRTERWDERGLRYRRAVAAALIVAVPVSIFWLAATASAMEGVTIAIVSRETYETILFETAIGHAWLVRMAALFLAVALVVFGRRWTRITLPVLIAASGVALGALAWTGHGAMDDGIPGWVHLFADIAHLLAAGAWIGALFAFLGLACGRPADPSLVHRVLHGFARTGTALVLILLATGLINSWMLVAPDRLDELPSDGWGRLLLIKLALFVAMLVLAAANRFRLTPTLGDSLAVPGPALAALRRSIAIELAAGLTILLLVGAMGTSSPPALGS